MWAIARLFSYTRAVERERDGLQSRVTDLERRLEERTSYALMISGKPAPEAVKARVEEAVNGKPAEPVRTHTSLRLIRRDMQAEIAARRKPKDGPLGIDHVAECGTAYRGCAPNCPKNMTERADEFAEKVKAGGQ